MSQDLRLAPIIDQPSYLSADIKKVSIEVPEDLQTDIWEIYLTFKTKFPEKEFFIVADSPFSDCCPDIIAAEHSSADLILKFGDSCEYNTDIPLVNQKLPDRNELVNHFLQAYPERAADKIFIINDSALIVPPPSDNICFISTRNIETINFDSLPEKRCFLAIDLPLWKVHQTALILAHRSSSFDVYQNFKLQKVEINRLFSQRKLQSVDSSGTFGLLLNYYGETHNALESDLLRVIRASGRPCYTFAIGKPTPMKLANFPEIRFWVIIGCSKTVFVSDEYYSILLTPFEALCALGICDFWNDYYTFDTNKLLEKIRSSELYACSGQDQERSLITTHQQSMDLVKSRALSAVPLHEIEDFSDQANQILRGNTGVARSYNKV